jgi:predicted HicB family RNase H-like nuclease
MERNDDTVNLVLRLKRDLHQQLTAEAERSERSLQREMIWRLRRSLEQSATTEAA